MEGQIMSILTIFYQRVLYLGVVFCYTKIVTMAS